MNTSRNFNEIVSLAADYEANLPPLEMPANSDLSEIPIASWIDHTLLKPEATPDQIEKLCGEAAQYGFASVCVNPIYVPLCSRLLEGSGIPVCSVVGFPLGATLPAAKAEETELAIEFGAREIDMVVAIGLLRGGDYPQVAEDIMRVVEVAHSGGAIVKVILEMALLDRRQKILGCLLSQLAGADFVKTSTGFGPGGATTEDVELMRRAVGPVMGVKAAGGVRSLGDARAMLQAGATRLGSSSGVKIVQEAEAAGLPASRRSSTSTAGSEKGETS